MKQFNKTLIAAALMVAAGSANASIQNTQGGLNEAFMEAYSLNTGKTFAFDTGVTWNTLAANISNSAFSLSYDFTNDANWTSFLSGATLSTIKYVVAVGTTATGGGVMMTGAPIGVSPNGLLASLDASNFVEKQPTGINSGLVNNSALNVSKLILDTDASGSGQYADANHAWGGWDSDIQATYGQATGFQKAVLDDVNFVDIATTFAGSWKLAGNSLTFAAPAVTPPPSGVPLPAAVWLFGAGLMGVLRLNRRKSMAA